MVNGAREDAVDTGTKCSFLKSVKGHGEIAGDVG
jgi:hypothetical protein